MPLLVTTDAFAPQLVVLAARHAIPTVYFRREFAATGGLMNYAANVNESYRPLGVYAARILKGVTLPNPTLSYLRDPPPTLRKRRHRGLARRRVAVRRGAILVVTRRRSFCG